MGEDVGESMGGEVWALQMNPDYCPAELIQCARRRVESIPYGPSHTTSSYVKIAY